MTHFNGYNPSLIAMGVGVVAVVAGAVDPSLAVALAGGGGVAGAAALAWLCHDRGSRARAEQARSHAVDAVLSTAPHPWCRVVKGDVPAAAAGFAALLGAGPPARLTDVAAALVPADAAAFTAAATALDAAGTGFRLAVESREGRRLVLTGVAAAGGMVVWAEDATATVRAQSVADQALRSAESAAGSAETETVRLRTALEALPLPVWMRGGDLAVMWCNRAYARAVETEPAAAVAEARELVPADGGRQMAARARTEGAAQSRRCTVAFGTQRRLLEVTEVSLPLAGGEVLALGFALDVTEAEDQRSELARHEAAHAEVLERLGSAICVFGPDMRLRFHNQAYARLWELDEAFLRTEPTHGEVLEDLRTRRKLPEYADFPSFKRERLAQYTRLIEPMEEMMHLPDGTTLRVLVAPHPLGGLIMIMEDVTNTLALESSYNTLMAVQQETLDNLAEGIAVYGGDGRLKLSNPSYARIWNLSDQELQGEPHIADILERMRPLFVGDAPSEGPAAGGFGLPPMAGWGGDWDFLKDEMIGATLERAVRSGRLERRDGSVVEFSTVPLPDGAVLTSYLDVTDSARLEQALRASNAALEAADQLKTEFIANVSHHLRTPLNSIMGYSDMLAGQYFGPLTPRQAECVTSMQTAGERLLGLIDDVVDLASIGAGVTTLDRGPVDLADVVETVAGLTQEWARREELRLDVTILPGLGTLEGDDKRLKQALFTLVVAAIRSRPANGRVVLRAERTGDGARLTVGDPAAAGGERRFESPSFEGARFDVPPFDTAHFDGARFEPAGTDPALGLALVRNVIDLHGGRMEVSEAPGCGLLVRCSLPVAAQAG